MANIINDALSKAPAAFKGDEATARVFTSVKACATDNRATYPRFKQSQIIELYNGLLKNEDDIIRAISEDAKRPKFEVSLEFLAVVKHLKALFDENDFYKLTGHAKSDLKHGKVTKPLGVVVIIAHNSSPLDSWISPLASAISAGNVAITVLPDGYPSFNALISKLLKVDPSAYSFLLPSQSTIDTLLSLSPDSIVCTSTQPKLRSAVGDAAASTGGHAVLLPPIVPGFTASSVSKVAAIINDSTSPKDLRSIAKLVARGKFFNAGRGINNIDYLLVHEVHRPAFVDLLVEATREMFGGDPILSGDFGRVVEKGEVTRLQALLKNDVVEGQGKVMTGGSVEGTFVSPTIVDGVTRTSILLQELINGPILPVVPFSSLEDVLSIQAPHVGHIVYAFGSDVDITYLAKEIPNVIVYSNDVPLEVLVGASSLEKTSGLPLGIRHAPSLFSTSTQIRSRASTTLTDLNLYAPFGPSKIQAIAKLIHSTTRLQFRRVSHPPIMRRSFFPQGLFFMLGSALTLTVGLSGWGIWGLVKFVKARN